MTVPQPGSRAKKMLDTSMRRLGDGRTSRSAGRPVDDALTFDKLKGFIKRWIDLVRLGCVSRAAFGAREVICSRCAHNVPASDNPARRICDKCGCGERRFATLTIRGENPEAHPHPPRLWMPDPNCPKKLLRPAPGTGTLEPVGGRKRQVAALLAAALDEAKRLCASPAEAVTLVNEIRKSLTRKDSEC